MKTAGLLVCLVLAVVPRTMPQDKVGDFTRSPTEHIINEIDQPFVVTYAVGSITMEDDTPMLGVLFEIQGPDNDRKIRRCITGENGRFKIGHVPQGTYRFKATLKGYQSVMGTVTVSKKAARTSEIKFAMPVGV